MMVRGRLTAVLLLLYLFLATSAGELLQNGDFEALAGWDCWGMSCTLTANAKRSGQFGVEATGRSKTWQGPSQFITLNCGQSSYHAKGFVKLLTPQTAQTLKLTVDFTFTDDTHKYIAVDERRNVQSSDGWVLLQGSFTLPVSKALARTRVYFEGPAAGVNFAVDDASVLAETCDCSVPMTSEGELLQNGDFEALAGWDCWGMSCTLTANAKRSGQFGVEATGRSKTWQGPSQFITVNCGQSSYHAKGFVKLLTPQTAQTLKLTVDFTFTDNTHKYIAVDERRYVRSTDGWVLLRGSFTLPASKALSRTRVYFEGPAAGVNFAVDDASVLAETCDCRVPMTSEEVIEQLRKSDINFEVTTASNVNKNDVTIQVRQVKKSFPFGTAISAYRYNSNAAGGRYREIAHTLFNWAVLENALKWSAIEPQRGQTNYQRALDTINGLRSHGIKVRGHTLVWSVDRFVQGWVKQLYGQELRDTVQHHIQETMNMTRGLLEHWDVNNENLHGTWYQDRLQDPDYNLELFRIAHYHDPSVKLFLNDYNVVASGGSTNAYLNQAEEVKAANVGLYGLGVQCHFGNEQEPDTTAIKSRLDTLAKSGLPIWVTELDVQAADENRRADFYEKALRAFYGHPAVEGILFWGFWDQAHWKGDVASLYKGNNLEPTAAGVRVKQLFTEEWMTKESHVLAEAGDSFTVRGFHGDYEVSVLYGGQTLSCLKTTFTLGKEPHTVRLNINV